MATGNGTPADERATRRQFFRVFGRQTVSGAGSVIAGVDALRRTSRDAMDDLLSGEEEPPLRPADLEQPPAAGADSTASPAAAPFRSPYRPAGDTLEILDQRELPGRAVVIECTAATEVASAIRCGLLSGGPVLGQVAAYTLAMVVARHAESAQRARQSALLSAADTLRPARPTNHALGSAVERMLARAESAAAESAAGAGAGSAATGAESAAAGAASAAATDGSGGTADEPRDANQQPEPLAGALLDEADRIAQQDAADHARLGRLGAEALGALAQAAAEQGRPLSVLMHGDHGPLTGGQVGTGVAVLQSLAASGCALQVWLTEAAPLLEGRRAAWQLAQLDIAHTLVPDTALGWLLAHRAPDALLLRAEWLLANGDLVAPLGSLVAARQARAAGLHVAACVPLSLYDPATADGSLVPVESRMPVPAAGQGPRIDPAADVVPASLVDLLLTDEGELRAPYREALIAAGAARVGRHAGHPAGKG